MKTAVENCRSCRRYIQWVDGVGWLHETLPQHVNDPLTCTNPVPVCLYGVCAVSAESSTGCTCESRVSRTPEA